MRDRNSLPAVLGVASNETLGAKPREPLLAEALRALGELRGFSAELGSCPAGRVFRKIHDFVEFATSLRQDRPVWESS